MVLDIWPNNVSLRAGRKQRYLPQIIIKEKVQNGQNKRIYKQAWGEAFSKTCRKEKKTGITVPDSIGVTFVLSVLLAWESSVTVR